MEPLPDFVLAHPRTVDEAVALRATDPSCFWISGGTDLMPNLRRGIGGPSLLIDLAGIDELRSLSIGTNGRVRIGAGVTLERMASDATILRDMPALAVAAASVGGPSHRQVATLGGNLCLDTRCIFYNQSLWWREGNGFCLKHGGTVCHVAPTGKRCHAAFSGDVAPVLLVLDSAVEIAGLGGRRTMPLHDLYAEDGAAHLCLAPDEMVTAVEFEGGTGVVAGYEKARQRDAIDFPLAGVAVALKRDGERLERIRVALTGTNSRPILLAGTDRLKGQPLDEAALGALDRLVQKQVSPLRTTIAASHYRRQVAAALTRRLAARLFAGFERPHLSDVEAPPPSNLSH